MFWDKNLHEYRVRKLGAGASAQILLGERYLQLQKPFRHKAIFGGRGSAKSHSVGTILPIITAHETKRVVCGRQFQNSIKDSVKELLEAKINQTGLADQYKIYEREIVHKKTESRYSFIGLDRNPQSAKSLEGCDIFWGEEANTFSTYSMEILMPTIRKPGSEMWWTWNPQDKTDPVDAYFRGIDPPENSLIMRVGIEDNPWFYMTAMPAEMEHMKRGNYKRYLHIWCGDYDEDSESKIFPNVTVGRVEVPDYCAPRYGMDFGFGQDPSFIVKVYVHEPTREIYIAREWCARVPLAQLPSGMDTVIDDRGDLIKCDSSQPGTIEHLNSQGFLCHGAKKGPGSVKSGITWLQGYKIIIDPDCKNMVEEAHLYSWQIDRITRQRLSVPVDAHNHGWDAVRYATEDCQTEDGADEDGGVMRLRFGRRPKR